MGYFPNVPDFQNAHQFFQIRRAVLILATALLRSKAARLAAVFLAKISVLCLRSVRLTSWYSMDK